MVINRNKVQLKIQTVLEKKMQNQHIENGNAAVLRMQFSMLQIQKYGKVQLHCSNKCMFGSILTKIDFKWIDYVKKSKIKPFMFRSINVKESWTILSLKSFPSSKVTISRNNINSGCQSILLKSNQTCHNHFYISRINLGPFKVKPNTSQWISLIWKSKEMKCE